MSWLIGLVIGGIVGWLSIYAMSEDRRGSVLTNIIVGALGGVFGIWFFFLGLGIMTASVAANYWLAILWAVIGSLVFVAIVNSLAWSIARREMTFDGRRMSRGVPHEYEDVEVRRRKKDRFEE